MNNIIIGTAGHVDHGKSSLIRALTGVETDRLSEEKKRGITIELGFAWLDLPDGGKAGIIDVPGHERFISNMLAGAAGMDLVLLIVAADEGVMPQTKEHLEILSLLGIPQGIIVLNKVDLVDQEWLELVVDDVREACRGSFLENAPVHCISALTGQGIEELRQEIFKIIEQSPAKDLNLPFRLGVDRAFAKDGFGLVVTGTCISGKVSKGQDLMLYPDQIKLKVRSIQVHGQAADQGSAGQRLAINLSGASKNQVTRGKWLASPDSLIPSSFLEVKVSVLPSAQFSIKTESRLHFHHGASEQLCRIILYGKRELLPGETGFARLNLEQPIVAETNDPFVLRFYSPISTIAGGLILDPVPPKRSLAADQRVEFLDRWQTAEPSQRLALSIDSQSRHYQNLSTAVLRAGLDACTESEIESMLSDLVASDQIFQIMPELYISTQHLNKLGESALKLLLNYHSNQPLKSGMRREEARSRILANESLDIQEGVLLALIEKGLVKAVDNLIAAPQFSPQRGPEVIAYEEQIIQAYKQAGYEPFERSDLSTKLPEAQLNQGWGKLQAELNLPSSKDYKSSTIWDLLLEDLIDQGQLIRLNNDLLISSEYYQKALDFVKVTIADQGGLKLADFRDYIKSSRKYAVAILERMDRDKITKLRNELRVLV